MQNEQQRGERYAHLSQLEGYRVSDEDPDPRGWSVVGPDRTTIGIVEDLIVDTSAMTVRYLDVSLAHGAAPGGRARIPTERVDLEPRQRRVVTNLSGAEWSAFVGRTRTDEEEVRAGTQPAQAGEVVVGKRVETERVTTPVQRRVERVRIERRPVNEATGRAELREGEIRVPLVEEEVVVQKRPVVKEEIVITRVAETETQQIETDVRRERVDISGDEELVEGEAVTNRPGARGGNRG